MAKAECWEHTRVLVGFSLHMCLIEMVQNKNDSMPPGDSGYKAPSPQAGTQGLLLGSAGTPFFSTQL